MRHEFAEHGGLLTIDLGEVASAKLFMEHLQDKDRSCFIAVSFGFFDTLMSRPAGNTSSEMVADALERSGISPGIVRMSVGHIGSLEQRGDQLVPALTVFNLL